MHARNTLNILFLSVLLPGLALAETHDASHQFERTVPLDDTILLDVDTGSGSISVRGGSVDEATIVGKIKVNRRWFGAKPGNEEEIVRQVRDNPPIVLDDGRLRVGYFEDRSLGKQVSISFTITVPADTEVVADTGSGPVYVADIAAPVDVDTGSGSIELENIGGPVRADTGSGSIRADGVAGEFEADTGSGSIYLHQTAPGDVRVDTGSGSTELVDVAGAVQVDSGSGRISVQGTPQGRWRLDSGSGSVSVDLPDDAAFTLDAESDSGGIVVDHPLMVQGEVSKKHVRGEVRGGGPLLRIDTGSGAIRVH